MLFYACSQLVFVKIDHFLIKVQTRISAVDEVVFIGENKHIEVLSGFNQGAGVFYRILVMYVIVGSPMYQQQIALQLSC